MPVRQVLQAVVLLQLGGDQGLPVSLKCLLGEAPQLRGKVGEEGLDAGVQVRRCMRPCIGKEPLEADCRALMAGSPEGCICLPPPSP